MAITRTAMVDDDGTGTTGTVINNAWKQQFYDQIDAAIPTGVWTAVPYNAADYSASGGGTWTVEAGDITMFRYALVSPKTMIVAINFNNTAVAGTVNYVTIKIPGGASCPNAMGTAVRVLEGATRSFGFIYSTGTSINVEKVPYTPVTAGVVGLFGTIAFEIA